MFCQQVEAAPFLRPSPRTNTLKAWTVLQSRMYRSPVEALWSAPLARATFLPVSAATCPPRSTMLASQQPISFAPAALACASQQGLSTVNPNYTLVSTRYTVRTFGLSTVSTYNPMSRNMWRLSTEWR